MRPDQHPHPGQASRPGIEHLGNREALYRRTAEISPPGRSSRCGGVLIGRP